MQPLPMFEFLQANLNECYFKVEAEVMEWNALTAFGRKPASDKATTVPSRGKSAEIATWLTVMRSTAPRERQPATLSSRSEPRS